MSNKLTPAGRIFFTAFFTSLSVALINGYPLLFWDSYGYMGFGPDIGRSSGRSVTLDFLARLPYPLLGVWSVVLIQATAFAYLIQRFAARQLPNAKAIEVAALIILSQLPLYTSVVMADSWLVILILAFMLLVEEFRWPPMLILAAAITVHGSHLYIFIVVAALAFVILRRRGQVLRVSIGALVIAFLFTGFVNGLTTHDRNDELAWSLVGSKILIQIPDAITLKCERDPDFLMCAYQDNIRAAKTDWCTDHATDCFNWRSDSFFKKINIVELNSASRELFIFTLLNKPSAFFYATYADWLELHKAVCSYDFNPLPVDKPTTEPALPGAPMHPEVSIKDNPAYFRSYQAEGLWSSPGVCETRARLKMATYFVGLVSMVALFFLRSREAISIGTLCLAAIFANDVLFAALSGSYIRYHDRGLFLLLIPALLAAQGLRSRHDIKLNSSNIMSN